MMTMMMMMMSMATETAKPMSWCLSESLGKISCWYLVFVVELCAMALVTSNEKSTQNQALRLLLMKKESG
jgi:hypothetical protein